jgi:hypothetical protein
MARGRPFDREREAVEMHSVSREGAIRWALGVLFEADCIVGGYRPIGSAIDRATRWLLGRLDASRTART